MNLIIVSQEFPPQTGGIATQTLYKAELLAQLGHDILVVTASRGYIRKGGFKFRVHELEHPDDQVEIRTEEARRVAHSYSLGKSLEYLVSAGSPDLVDFPEYGGEAYFYLINRDQWDLVPVIVQLHGPTAMLTETIGWPEPESMLLKVGSHMERTCIELADAVYSSSRLSAEWCEREYGLCASKIPVMHAGIDTELFQPDYVSKSPEPKILFVGRINESKGVAELVSSACDLASEFPGLRIRLCGRGNEGLKNSLLEETDNRGFPELLEFLGPVSRNRLREELDRAHIFAAPSHYEAGPGFVFLEAMGCGLPVVGSSGSGLEEVIDSGKTGFLVPPRSVNDLSEVLRLLLSSPSLRRKIGRAARKWIVENVDSRSCIRRLEAFYLSVIKKARERKT